MNKLLISVLLCLGVTACSNTGKPEGSMDKPQIEEPPKTELESPVVESNVTETSKETIKQEAVEEKVTEEIKPKPKPKPLPTKTAEGKLILGEEEWVYLPGLDKSFIAKVDTGATTSSISAVDVIPFEREGKEWVKFRIEHTNVSTQEISLPILRWAKIKQANSADAQKRAVVTGWVQVGDVKEKADFTLTDRKHLSYPIILGQSFFRDVAIVDVSRKRVQAKKK